MSGNSGTKTGIRSQTSILTTVLFMASSVASHGTVHVVQMAVCRRTAYRARVGLTRSVIGPLILQLQSKYCPAANGRLVPGADFKGREPARHRVDFNEAANWAAY